MKVHMCIYLGRHFTIAGDFLVDFGYLRVIPIDYPSPRGVPFGLPLSQGSRRPRHFIYRFVYVVRWTKI